VSELNEHQLDAARAALQAKSIVIEVEAKRLRICSRDACSNPANAQTGGAIAGRLCRYHAQERRERQHRSRNQPKCGCGNAAPLDSHMCRRCQENSETSQATDGMRRKFAKCTARLHGIVNEINTNGLDIDLIEELSNIACELDSLKEAI